MKRDNFRKGIKKALSNLVTEKEICHEHGVSDKSEYVCDVISKHVNDTAKILYSELFEPTIDGNHFAFFGRCDARNIDKRRISILIFEQVCLVNKYYEEF